MTAVHDEPTTAALEDTGRLINHRDDEIELIPPDSLTAQLTGLYTFLPINGGAAFVMQVMHPVIGDVVDKYSVFRTDRSGVPFVPRTRFCAGPTAVRRPSKRASACGSCTSPCRRGMRRASTSVH